MKKVKVLVALFSLVAVLGITPFASSADNGEPRITSYGHHGW